MASAVGCKKDEKPPPTPPKKDFAAGLPRGGSLDGQLAAEAAARSNDVDTISLEKVQAAVADAGITFTVTRQVMAKNQLAIYCATADSADGVILTVCEYPSAEAAVNGEKEANVLANQIAGHSSRVRKKSVLHLIRKSTTPDSTVQQIISAFDGA